MKRVRDSLGMRFKPIKFATFTTMLFAVSGIMVGATAWQASAGTLADVKARGLLNCGVTTGLAGFAAPDDEGEWKGFDVDFCRAVAVAVFGDATAVNFVPTTSTERFKVLEAGEVDLLARNTTWTFDRDVRLNFEFAGINYYDGQGFMVRKSLGVATAKDLDGASVCLAKGTTSEQNLADYFKRLGHSYEAVEIQTTVEARQSYESGRCDIYTTDASGLAAQRAVMAEPKAHVILPEIISKEPLGPLVRQGDAQWADVVRWTLNALISAEELGLSSKNAEREKIETAEAKRLLGHDEGFIKHLGLSETAFKDVIARVGNYSEIFERNIGSQTNIGLERGLNALWRDGGLLYSPPFR